MVENRRVMIWEKWSDSEYVLKLAQKDLLMGLMWGMRK